MSAQSKEKVGIVIVGCGMISEFQSKAIGDLPNAEVVGYYDTISEMATARAEQFGAKAFSEIGDALKHPDVDAISICTPSGSHLEPALAAAAAGKHLMVEKPIEITTERVDQIIAACQAAGVTLGAIFSATLSGSKPGTQKGRRRWSVWSDRLGGCLHQVVSNPGVLRQRRLAWHLEARRRGSANESRDPRH